MLEQLSQMVAEKLIWAPYGEKELPAAASYAAPPTSVNDAAGKQLHAELSHFRALPLTHVPGGDVFFGGMISEPGYHLKKTENMVVRAHQADLATITAGQRILVEFGPGGGDETREYLRQVGVPAFYIGVEIAASHLEIARPKLAPLMPVEMIEGNFMKDKLWKAPFLKRARSRGLPLVGFIPGSTLGNFTNKEFIFFLKWAGKTLDELVIGLDSSDKLVEGAYGAPVAPIAAQFYLNGLVHAGRIRDLQMPLTGLHDRFAYHMNYNVSAQCVEINMISRVDQEYPCVSPSIQQAKLLFNADIEEDRVRLRKMKERTTLTLKAGESIRCMHSFKRNGPTLDVLFHLAGWQVAKRMSFADAMKKPHQQSDLPFPNEPDKNKLIDYSWYYLKRAA